MFAVHDDLKNKNLEMLPASMLKDELEAFEKDLNDEQKKELKDDRAMYLKFQKCAFADERHWWNRLNNMGEREMKLLPYSFLKKYGSHLRAIKRM